jgi:uncharacterized protein
MATTSLAAMAAGGIYDHIGGGFARYSTDATWTVPHFEKMLYDQAGLVRAYLHAWQVTGEARWLQVVEETVDYVLSELASPGPGLCSAQDADSEGEEGRFFVWDEAEIRAVLGEQAGDFGAFYGVTPGGNFEGRNILAVAEPDEDRWASLADARAKLYAARERRPHPLRDEKILTAWNGLMISALAFGGRVLGEPRYVEAAGRAARFVLDRMRPGGRLARTFTGGAHGPPGFLSDHAFLAQSLLDLHEATFDPGWLAEALAVAEAAERLFADPRGGWYVTGEDQEKLLAREKPTHDGAEPSGASVALLNAVRLEAFTGDARWRKVAEAALRWYAPTLAEQPVALTELAIGLDAFLDGPGELVLVWPRDSAAPAAMLEVLRRAFLPGRALTGAAEGEALLALASVAPVAAGRAAVDGRPTVYLCERGACRLPVDTPERLAELLRTGR